MLIQHIKKCEHDLFVFYLCQLSNDFYHVLQDYSFALEIYENHSDSKETRIIGKYISQTIHSYIRIKIASHCAVQTELPVTDFLSSRSELGCRTVKSDTLKFARNVSFANLKVQDKWQYVQCRTTYGGSGCHNIKETATASIWLYIFT